MFALSWRCDGSEGIKWYIRGIREDGSFYGEVRFQSELSQRRWSASVSGQLSPAERERLVELLKLIREAPPPEELGSHFGALFERWPSANAGAVRRLFEYHRGDEESSLHAQAFVELVGLFEQHWQQSRTKVGYT
jgi:hypothetical protein